MSETGEPVTATTVPPRADWDASDAERTGPAGATPVPVRRAIAVLLSRFPLVTETFILREIEELERQGQPVRLVPLMRETPAVIHREAQAWLPRALFTPFLSRAILQANARALARQPYRYLLLLARVLLGSLRSWNVLIRTAALFPKCVYLAERLEREGIRHVHAHYATHPATAAYIIASLTPITFSFTVHAHDLFVSWRRALLGAKARRACFIRVISEFNRHFLRALYPGCADKIRVIHMGIDPGAFRSGGSSSAGKTPATPRLVCVAALQPYKGLPVLIDAGRQLADAGLQVGCDIVGEGWLRPSLEERIARYRLNERVRLRGALRQDQVAALLRDAAIAVLPSVVARDGQMEGIPVALIEAMAAERPVIASALSGIPELVDHGLNGLLVEPGNAAALADAIAALLSDTRRRRDMGRHGREKVERHFRLDGVTRSLRRELDRWNPPPGDVPGVRDLAGAAGFAAHQLGVRGVRGGRDSRVTEVMAADGRRTEELILKTHRTRAGASRVAPERARREYDVLTHLGHRFAAAGTEDEMKRSERRLSLRTPRPLAIRMTDASLVMERCAGDRLDDLIRRARRDPDGEHWTALEHAVEGTGHWVRRLHEVTRRSDPWEVQRAWDAVLDAAQRDAPSSPAAEETLRRLEGMRRRGPPTVDLVGCHGDLSPGNILATSSSVVVVDFEGYHEGLPWEDVAYFLLHLELYFPFAFRAGRFARLRDAFLAGAAVDPEPLGLELCRTAAALRALAHGQVRSWRAWPHAALLRRAARDGGGG